MFCWQHQNCQRTIDTKIEQSKQSQDINTTANKKSKVPFSGIKAIDKIILLSVADRDLGNILQISSYFHSFYDYEPLWREKILREFGVGRIKTYTGSNWRQYYMSLCRYANIYEIPSNDDWVIWLEQRGYKIRYGDIVVRDTVRTIYDGQQLIEFEAKSEYRERTIPQSFYVLSENHGFKFPLDYWKNTKPEIRILWLKTSDLTFSLAEYVNIEDVGDDNNDIDFVYTNFEVSGVTYTLEYRPDKEIDIGDADFFDSILDKFEYVPFFAKFEANFSEQTYKYVTGVHLLLDDDLVYDINPKLYEELIPFYK